MYKYTYTYSFTFLRFFWRVSSSYGSRFFSRFFWLKINDLFFSFSFFFHFFVRNVVCCFFFSKIFFYFFFWWNFFSFFFCCKFFFSNLNSSQLHKNYFFSLFIRLFGDWRWRWRWRKKKASCNHWSLWEFSREIIFFFCVLNCSYFVFFFFVSFSNDIYFFRNSQWIILINEWKWHSGDSIEILYHTKSRRRFFLFFCTWSLFHFKNHFEILFYVKFLRSDSFSSERKKRKKVLGWENTELEFLRKLRNFSFKISA